MKVLEIDVKLEGLADILFDKFKDHSKEVRPPEQKLYLVDDNQLVLPSENVRSFFLTEGRPMGIIKIVEGKKANDFLRIAQGALDISPTYIPFLDEKGKSIKFIDFGPKSKFFLFEQAGKTGPSNARVKQEVQARPGLRLPWTVNFTLRLFENALIDATKLYNYMTRGGIEVGFLNYRPRFGRFVIVGWEVREKEVGL